MNPILKKALIAIGILSVLALLMYAFMQNFEYVEKTQRKPLTGEARTNPLYASQLFLRRMGIPTKTLSSLQDLDTLPDTDTVILVSSTRQTLRPTQINALLAWVSGGGHLIISGIVDWNFFASESDLVDESNNANSKDRDETETSEDEPIYYEESDEDFDSASDDDPLQEFLEVQIRENIQFNGNDAEAINLTGSVRPLKLGPDYYRAIILNDDDKTTGLEQVAINGKNVIIRQQIDEGLITLASDLDFISNYKLGKFDHAEILWQLVRGKPATLRQSALSLPQAVWLIHSDKVANLFEIIWKYFWALVITLGLLFLLWVLRASRRFGPLIPKQTEDRRNLLEHIDASGNYYWQHKEQSVLLDSTRSAAQQQLAKRIPGWQAMSQQDQIQLLAKRLNVTEPQILKALHGTIGSNPYEFTETIKQLENIRTRL